MKNQLEAKEVIEGLMKGLSAFSYLTNQYANYAIPALEKAQEYLDGLESDDPAGFIVELNDGEVIKLTSIE